MSRPTAASDVVATPHRFRLSRAGVLNVWQYDDQVFELADGRLLLRGANGAGKSKTLEMLLPFALDGDKMRITASGRHHTSLLWLMTDGYEGNRTGYVWVEFVRDTEDGVREVLTCGIGVRASSTSKVATSWFFTCPRRVGDDLLLEDDAGPLPKERCRLAVAPDGHFFEQARAYKSHVGRVLFGLDAVQYDELLRLLYWLRQPQVGEDIEPGKLTDQLAQALPQVDDDAIRSAGDTFDELVAFGETIDRRHRAAEAVASFAATYADYARTVARSFGAALVEAHRELARRADQVQRAQAKVDAGVAETESAQRQLEDTGERLALAEARLAELGASPEARSHARLLDLERRAGELAETAGRALVSAGRAGRRAEDAGHRVARDATGLSRDLARFSKAGQDAVADAARAGVPVTAPLPATLVQPTLDHQDDVDALRQGLSDHVDAVTSVRPGVGERLAAVAVVDDARREAERAGVQRDEAERRAADAERRAEEERGRREDAAREARAAETRFADAVETWASDPRAVAVALPELSASTVGTLAVTARSAAAPELDRCRAVEAEAGAERVEAERDEQALRARRVRIEAERDPAPPEPVLGRTPRENADGAPLWRLVDFAEHLSPQHRAGLEAALESSGLLDAWVRSDGAVLDGERRDVVLPAGAPLAGPSLGGLVCPDVPVDCPVPVEVVESVLARVGAGGLHEQAWVDVDGSWRLGPLTGRAAKDAAQYVGATARAAERTRRLAEVDAQLADAASRGAAARAREQDARRRRTDLEAWLAAAPSAQALLAAWTRLDERAGAAVRAEAVADEAERVAVRARAHAVERRRTLDELAGRHDLPTTAEGLAARREALRAAEDRLVRHVEAAAPLRERLDRWGQDWAAWRADVEHAADLRAEANAHRVSAEGAAEQHRTLAEAVGADVEELQQRLAGTRREIAEATRHAAALRESLGDLRERLGAARTELATAEGRRREQHPVVVGAAQALSDMHDVPGLARSAHQAPPAEDDLVAVELARGVTPGSPVPRKVVELARRLAALPEPRRAVDDAGVFAAWQEVASSDAADHEPRVVSGGPALAALGRDDGGEHPVVVLAERLTAAVAHDRDLLTERERTLFEEHLIGELGEALRRRRLEAEDLVAAMNRLLAGVTTSQGIAVQLRWQLRDDVGEDARRAVMLLGREIGALLPSERSELRDSLHRLIEASRAEAPEESYTEHLARALDYRRWFAFRIRYTRPELEGRWHDLHRRSPLSQGEQKVVCYLPLFAAAAAHFTSLAGAAPHAPRFVLLDDAFPKIDVRTHPLLFGLLVDLDLDFVVTSERLWGDHSTVPSLAIYEALRDPGERGIAQYRYLWDGARLHAVGA